MAKLVINPTSAAKKEIPLAGRAVSIGRDPSNDLVLSDSMVSRRHAILEQRNDHFILRDNNSSNGTLVNGDRVDKEQTLQDGDLVAIGSVRLLFQVDEETEDPSTPGNAGASSKKPVVAVDPASSTVGAELEPCPGCGKPTLRGDRFCRGCGRKLEPASSSVKCDRCGSTVPLPAEFCGHCGAPVPDGLAPAEPRARERKQAPPPPRSAPVPPRPRAGSRSAPSASAASRRGRAGTDAGFGIRLLAGLIDAVILGTPVLVVTLIWGALAVGEGARGAGFPRWAPLALGLGLPLFSFGYHVYFWADRGATPGKSLLGLVVCTETGRSPIGYPRAVARAIGYVISSLPLGLGFVWIALSDDGRGWHDRFAATRVSRVD